MLKAQFQNMGKRQKHLESYNVQKYEKIKDNFDAETVNLRINKCINAKLLKFNIFLH